MKDDFNLDEENKEIVIRANKKIKSLKKKAKKFFNKYVVKLLVRILWVATFFMSVETIKNIYYLQQIKPMLQELEIISLMFFFQVFYFNIIIVCICVGFLLLYYHNRRKKEVK